MVHARWFLVGVVLLMCARAHAAGPTPVVPDFPVIQSSGITVNVTPYITAPATSGTAPTARINYANSPQDGSGRVFVNDLNGVISVAGPGGGAASPYLDLRRLGMNTVPGTPGLSGMAFSPNFGRNPALPGYNTFYTIDYLGAVAADPSIKTIGKPTGETAELREWTASDPRASTFSGTSRAVMRVSGYSDGHANGMIAFNPTAQPGDPDYGNLYVGSGDGHYNDADGNAQRLDRPQGKMLRINPAVGPNGEPYTVPADNPFLSNAAAVPEIWASGLRFPQSFTWDKLTGTMYINDLGQQWIEEVNVGVAGANYGWGLREGTYATGYAFGHDSSDENIYTPTQSAASLGMTDPIAEYWHAEGNAIGSGLLYRGTAIPELYGKYLLGDIVVGRVFVFDPGSVITGGQAALSELDFSVNGRSVNLDEVYACCGGRVDLRLSQDANGEILVAVKSSGTVYALSELSIAVPEPSTWLLLGAPFAILSCLNRARRASITPA